MALLRLTRARIAFLHDVVMAAVAFLISLYLRLGDDILDYPSDELFLWTSLFTAVAAAVFASMRLYRGIWRYASLADMVAITKAVAVASLIFLPLMFLLTRLQGLPRSVVIINGFVLIGALGGPRILYRIFKDRSVDAVLSRDGHRRVPVLLVGAGDGAELFIRATRQRPAAGYGVVGIIDDKGGRIGRNIHGVDVMGGLDEIGPIVERLSRRGRQPERIVITTEALPGSTIAKLLDFADAHGMSLSRLPKITDFRRSTGDELTVQPIAIEDLLGRPQAVLDRDGMRALIAGKRVLVTGAGGTIGSELVRQIADFEPAHLTLLDYGEYNLYTIDLEIGERWPALSRNAVLCDVRDGARVMATMTRDAPDLVFHAAALKHVPVVETHPHEGILTNVVGTRNVADAGRAVGVRAVVLISTDKAVNPTSIMGSTKRVAESYCQALDISEMTRGGQTRFFTVRFGNVLGSTGSVVPLFQRQLAAGGPLTVTHPDVTRYFMTTREAVELVLQATALGLADDGDHGKIFVLDMGEPVRIADLAKQMIRLSGLQPGVDVKIEFVGLRPGEKLHEELFHAAEQTVPTVRSGILLAAPRAVDAAFLARAIEELADAAAAGRINQITAILRRLIPEAHLDDKPEDTPAVERLGS